MVAPQVYKALNKLQLQIDASLLSAGSVNACVHAILSFVLDDCAQLCESNQQLCCCRELVDLLIFCLFEAIQIHEKMTIETPTSRSSENIGMMKPSYSNPSGGSLVTM